MNINPAAAASVAGTSRAAAKGGESDNQAAQASARQSAATSPGGKADGDNSLEAGEQTGDRDANGRQILDVFERSGEEQKQGESPEEQEASSNHDGHLDLEA
ncbi:hypothetical protein LF1_41690 [Rubripirellula obstinata]|uniref:Uncharacterized protein n=1 Tax=Rubripirellula obstinata TaxID=406547 RepID=A0A5B1CKM9_9BACT|nr:hypothetical protein [Rubripirellula obstinata]KAA1261618.1 hypothetical protein LF1_41690 [Rubripirellula obstinata]